MEKFRPEDVEFSRDSMNTALKVIPFSGHLILWACLGFLFMALLWASFATLDEVIHSEGKVIPASSMQVVQSLEGGVLKNILVHEGDDVEKDQTLMEIDDTQAESSVQETGAKLDATKAKIVRLIAESEGKPLAFPDDLMKNAANVVQSETDLYESRQKELSNQISILKEQKNGKEHQLTESMGRQDQLQRNYDLAKKELDINKPLLAEGVVSQVDILKLERSTSDALGELQANKLAIPRLQSEIQGAGQQIEEATSKFRSQAQDEYNQAILQLKQLSASSTALQERLHLTTVRSPVKGTINQLLIHTVGGVVKPGADLIEIIPTEDTLLVEAKVRPSDIAGLRPELPVLVKITAYDSSIYGGLKGKVEYISAGTIKGEKPGENFYEIRVRTQVSYLEHNGKQLPIKAGMAANVDIMTGKKTVLDYLLKPIMKVKQEALTER